MAKRRHQITLVGAGNLASALLELLPSAGWTLSEVIVRSPQRRRSLTPVIRRSRAALRTLPNARFDGEIVWLAVGDSNIEDCAKLIVDRGEWKGKVVLHSSGALTSDELVALRRRGASVAAAHPMMSFIGDVPDLKHVAWTVEGDAKAVRVASEIVRDLGGVAFKIDKRRKPLYHAFGAFLSPLLVVHLQAAAQLAEKAGLSRRASAQFIGPIVRRTLHNLLEHFNEKDGAGKAFSGPLVRGDVGTVERHLKAMEAIPGPERLYRALVNAALDSRLPVKNRDKIRRLLRRRK